MELADRTKALVLAALLLVALIAGQAMADYLEPTSTRASTGHVVDRASFAYLTGIRTFAAALLWARMDPINDKYYHTPTTSTLAQKKFLMPNIYFVTMLDPTLEEPYYVGPWVLFDNHLKANALALAAEGARRNPQSALLHASYCQLLLSYGDVRDAAPQADLALAGVWHHTNDEYDSLTAMEVAFNKTGQKAKAARVVAMEVQLRAELHIGQSASDANSGIRHTSPRQ